MSLRKAQQLANRKHPGALACCWLIRSPQMAALLRAVPEYRHLLELHPNDAALQSSLAFAISEPAAIWTRRKRLVQTALRKFPGEPDFGDTLGSIYLKKRNEG